jgi:cathepsin L
MNRFAAFTPTEYKELLGIRSPVLSNEPSGTPRPPVANIGSIDWRDRGAVNAIRDQGRCGACWAFAAIVAAEGSYFVGSESKKTLLSLSESNLIDCVTACYACDGGLVTDAFQYVLQYQDGRFQHLDQYPYTPVKRNCAYKAGAAAGDLRDYELVTQGSEDDLATKCSSYGPIACAVDAGPVSFQLYSKGIYDDKACHPLSLNHGVGCVGFGVDGDTKYWIVRNSWGVNWGEHGYMRMIRGSNMCGIANLGVVAFSHIPPR